MVTIVGETEELAEAKYDHYRDIIDVEAVLALLSGFMDMDLSALDPDQRVEHIETEAMQGAVNAFTKADPDRDWTVAEMARFAGLGSTSPVVVGTPEQVADELGAWYRELPIAGFNVKEVARPDSIEDFVSFVVPELRERGLLDASEGDTLRERVTDGGPRLPNDHPARR